MSRNRELRTEGGDVAPRMIRDGSSDTCSYAQSLCWAAFPDCLMQVKSRPCETRELGALNPHPTAASLF